MVWSLADVFLLYNLHMKTSHQHIHARLLKTLLVLSLTFAFLPIAQRTDVQAEESSTESTPSQSLQLEEGTYDESKVIVKFKDTVESDTATSVLESTDSVKDKNEGEVEEIADNTATVKVEDGKSVADAIEDLKSDPRVEYAEPDYKLTLYDEDETSLLTTSVNDPYVSYQWHINDSYSKVKDAWDIAKCNTNTTVNHNAKVTVAIVDSGIDSDHPDLKNNVIAGYSVASSNTSNYEDKLGHGTKVAGIIAAQSNNKIAGTGVSYNANILPIKVTDDQQFSTSLAVSAISWAVKNKDKYNIKVINLSLGGAVEQAMEDAVESAWNAGILCVAASGNDGLTTGVDCPASSSATLSVGAVDSSHTRAYYSNGGSDLDVVAPGSEIYTTLLNAQFGYAGSGTSFAAPFVSATAALCYAANSSATPAKVKNWITSTAKDLTPSGKDIYTGYGQVVVKDAVTKAKSNAAVTTVTIYRLYNRYSGEHLFTDSVSEYNYLGSIGWNKENVAWTSPATSNTPVYRLYNPYSGDHHYTTSSDEYNYLGKIGWKKENVAFYSQESGGAAVYRLFNPYEKVGTHHYTTSKDEYDYLGTVGWKKESVGWYSIK